MMKDYVGTSSDSFGREWQQEDAVKVTAMTASEKAGNNARCPSRRHITSSPVGARERTLLGANHRSIAGTSTRKRRGPTLRGHADVRGPPTRQLQPPRLSPVMPSLTSRTCCS